MKIPCKYQHPIWKFIRFFKSLIPVSKPQAQPTSVADLSLCAVLYVISIIRFFLFGISVHLRTPHRFDFEVYYKNKNSCWWRHGRMKLIYDKIPFAQKRFTLSSKQGRIHCNVLPNHLKTFSYKLSKKILPCKFYYLLISL